MDWFEGTGLRIIIIIGSAVALYIVCTFLIRSIVKTAVSHYMASENDREIAQRSRTLSSILRKLLIFITITLAFLLILAELGVNISALLAGIGVGGLAVSFAAQNLVRDFITGFFIIMEDQYGIRDDITIAGVSGIVESVGLRCTVLRDGDGNVHYVPNGKVEVSTNKTKKYSRVNMVVTVGYGENLKQVSEVINRVCADLVNDLAWKDDFLTVPSVLRIDKLGDSGIDIRIRGDVMPSRQNPIMGELRMRLKDAFTREGIEIPWPHRKVFFGNTLSSRDAR